MTLSSHPVPDAITAKHVATLLKYSGISFISGAVNHGFFSGKRSLLTAGIGVTCFVLGAWLSHRQTPDHERDDGALWRTLAMGSALSIGLGFFTGGLQHFPDSPERSSWVVPLGFLISLWALPITERLNWTRNAWRYAILSVIVVTAISLAAGKWFAAHPELVGAHGHSHDDASHHDDHPAANAPTNCAPVSPIAPSDPVLPSSAAANPSASASAASASAASAEPAAKSNSHSHGSDQHKH